MIARRITHFAATVAAFGAISATTLGLAASANAAQATPATVTYNPVKDPAPSPVEGRQPVMAGAPATVTSFSW